MVVRKNGWIGLIVLLAVSFGAVSCTVEPDADVHKTQTEESINNENEHSAANDTENGAKEESKPTEDDVVKAYQKAREAASWFRIASMLEDGSDGPIDMSDRVVENDLTYFRVKRFDSYADFSDHLTSCFSDEVIESLLSYNGTMYIEHNGLLYGRFGMRGTNVFMGEETYDIEYVNDETVHLLVKVERWEQDLTKVKEHQTFLFPYEQREGKWVFTDFPEIR